MHLPDHPSKKATVSSRSLNQFSSSAGPAYQPIDFLTARYGFFLNCCLVRIARVAVLHAIENVQELPVKKKSY